MGIHILTVLSLSGTIVKMVSKQEWRRWDVESRRRHGLIRCRVCTVSLYAFLPVDAPGHRVGIHAGLDKVLIVQNLVLNKALKKAQSQGLIRQNPCGEAEIPSYDTPQKEMRPLKYAEVSRFLKQISGHPDEFFLYMALFTGMRESELIGLTWDCIDWDTSNIHLYRQLKPVKGRKDTWAFTTLKNKQSRDFIAPPSVICTLKKQKLRQTEWKLQYGTAYNNDLNLVFTNPLGKHLTSVTIYNHFKSIVTEMGLPEVRFHDLRHTYATLALQNGVDVKTVSNNLGHATVAFTMDKYVHVSMTMQKDCVSKMESFISSL
ncbi:MAG: site-specific integrase [Clostridia bacterium]|nr:site-specific integrase [Clostridia bacterium]